MKLRHIVITSVTRDDLEDGAAGHFARTIRAVRKSAGDLSVEVLTPDFLGRHALIDTVLNERPDVFNHNIETVKRLSRDIRPQADYERSLGVLCYAAENYPEVKTKSGLMVGLGEREDEVMETLRDLRGAGVQMVTIGQYLRPSAGCLPVAEFVTPEKFEYYGREARALGFEEVASGPFVRSSYNAEESFIRVST